MDLLKTRHREQRLISTCLETNQRFVIDNTNPTRAVREGYIKLAKASGYQVIGYYLQSVIEDCLRRNALRPPSERVPDVAILATAKKLELPQYDEGFDQIFYVRLDEGKFLIEEWRSDV